MIIYFYAPNLDCFGAFSCFFFTRRPESVRAVCVFPFHARMPARLIVSLLTWRVMRLPLSFSLWRAHKTAHRNFHAYQIKKGTQWARANSIFYFIEIGTCHRRTREETQAGNCRLFFTTSHNIQHIRRERASFFVEAQFAGPWTNSRLTEQFEPPEFLSP